MDKRLLQKYFRNQCSLEEIEQVLDWFQTEEGATYFEQRLDRDMERYSEDDTLLLHPDVPSQEMLQTIERKSTRNQRTRAFRQWFLRTGIFLLISGAVLGVGYWFQKSSGLLESADSQEEVVYRTITTHADQHRLITLRDGSTIRLNQNSSIVVPERFSERERVVTLKGEAFFTVARDADRPFIVDTDQAVVRVLGTEFNVKVDVANREVQVAVSEGKVSLRGQEDVSGREAILTENTFGLYQSESREMLIERTPVDNYLSWISGRLYFHNEPLQVVGRYLERLYGVKVVYESQDLEEMFLSTDLENKNLESVLDIISRTLGIDYEYAKAENLVKFVN